MITRRQSPRRDPVHGEYVRVAVADLVEGNRYIFGGGPTVGTVAELDVDPRALGTHPLPGYRWVNRAQRERRSFRDVLVTSLTQDQRDEILED
jgi:hypothetical protein